MRNNFLTFIQKSQELKKTLRHSWITNKSRQESAAEHTWHLTLMALVLEPYLRQRVDLLRVLKMLIVHDLGEAVTGDIPAFEKGHDDKYKKEKRAIKEITKSLSQSSQAEILSLWKEFEEKKTKEALFAKMLDILDVLHQHLIADLSTWAKIEFKFNIHNKNEKYFRREPEMLAIYKEIIRRLKEKVRTKS